MPEKESYKVLFIEDSLADICLTKAMIGLDEIPIKAHFIKDAPDALKYLSSIPKDEFPEIIITDVNMPMMNGYEFVQIYKERFYHLNEDTLLFVSSSSIRKKDKALIEKLKIVKGYFEKPFSLEAFQKYIQNAVETLPIRVAA